MKLEKTRTCYELCENLKELKKTSSNYKNYTLRYFYNKNELFFHLFMHTIVCDKITNENIEKQGILLKSWNPISKQGEQYLFNKGKEIEGDDDLNIKKIYLPNTKTIFEFSHNDFIKEKSWRLAVEIISMCPHNDIEMKIINSK